MRDARTRLIVPRLPEPGTTLSLGGSEAAHLRARRLAAGDSVVLLDGSGREARAEIVATSRGKATLRVSEILGDGSPTLPTTLFLAGLKPDRLSWAVEKATELGATQVNIVRSERTQSFRAAPTLLPRLERVARESAKQCGRADWPSLSGPVPIERVLADERSAHRLFLDFDGAPFPRKLSGAPAALVIGPEGGWTAGERNAAAEHGWTIVTLPAGRLRAETAAVAALALVNAARER
ncbi:MAG TPA: RsmE family RNA methyltransferase [Thermoanaerobaculia bacterium]|nr:RsmE family RNA methyltransferase [Thermoanaerobaculia bacterium]